MLFHPLSLQSRIVSPRANVIREGSIRYRPLPCFQTCVLCSFGAILWAGAFLHPQAVFAEDDNSSSIILVEGQVTDHIGQGQADVKVTVHLKKDDGSLGELITETLTDDIGDFSLTTSNPVHDDCIVTITKESFKVITREIHIGDDEFPPFLAETLEGTLVLAGQVLIQKTQKPVSAASVTLKSFYRDWSATTDKEGRFSIEGISPGGGQLVVDAKGFGRESVNLPDVSTDAPVEVLLSPERTLTIMLLDDLKKPIEAGTIEIHDQLHDDFRTIVSDASGRAIIKGLHFLTKEIGVRLTHESYVSSEEFDRKITLPEDSLNTTETLTMQRAGKIVGIVNDFDGAPCNGARVMIGETYGDNSPRDWTSYQGKYEIKGVPPGQAVVTVHANGFSPDLKTVEVKAGEEAKLSFTLGRPATLEGFVRTEKGDAMAGMTVYATKWRGYQTLGLRAMTDAKGRFVLENAPNDEFVINVGGLRADEAQKAVKASDNEPVQFALAESVAKGQGPGSANSIKTGDDAPDVVLTTLDGSRISLRELKGRTVVIDFWATWCGPCVAEIPELVALHKKYAKDENFLLLGVSMDSDEKALKTFLKRKKIPWQQVFGDESGATKAAEAFGAFALPAIYVLGPDGKIAGAWLRGPEVGATVESLLESK